MKNHAENKELEILFPVAKLTIAGEEIQVREYTLLQQLQHNHKLMPFVQSLRSVLTDDNIEFGVEPVMACIAEHYQDVLELVALSVDKPVEFVQNLTGEDADNLLLAWWGVNSDFFTRKAVTPMLEQIAKNNLQMQMSAGAKS